MNRHAAFRLFVLSVLLLGGILPAAHAASPSPAAPAAKPADDWKKDLDTWRQQRLSELKAEDGWLTLVGLFWLDEGDNAFGSSPENKVILPAGKSPAVAGVLTRHGDTVHVKVDPRAQVTSGGKPVTEMDLKKDSDGGEPTTLEIGPLSFYIIQRGDRLGVRVKDKTSETLAHFHGVDSYPAQAAWRIEARFEPYEPAKKVPIPNILGQVADEDSPGAVVFDWQGKTYRLDALGDTKDGLFLIFGDPTNGKETYGAGRFLTTDPPKDGKVVVDFNRAYNPPCAFTAFATCPLPPAQNKLALRVEAGEKKFAGGPHH
jgi:hypothetical protein